MNNAKLTILGTFIRKLVYMEYLKISLITFVALEHLYFLILEMFLWTKPRTIKIFGIRDKKLAEDTKVLAANQGLYNGFLSVGLIKILLILSVLSNPIFCQLFPPSVVLYNPSP